MQALVRTDALTKLLELMSAVPGGIKGEFMKTLNETVDRVKTSTKPISIRRLVEVGP